MLQQEILPRHEMIMLYYEMLQQEAVIRWGKVCRRIHHWGEVGEKTPHGGKVDGMAAREWLENGTL